MDATTIIALGMAAYALFSGKKKEQELQEKNDVLQAKVDAAAASRAEGQDLEISAKISISSIADNLWNCLFEWTIKNNGTQAYYLQDIKSAFSIAGYQVNNWTPGNRSLIRIDAGQTMKIQSSVNDKKLWVQGESAKKVRERILSALGCTKISEVHFPVPYYKIHKLAAVHSTAYTLSSPYHDITNEIKITSEIPCTLEYPQRVKIFAKYGSDAKTWKTE